MYTKENFLTWVWHMIEDLPDNRDDVIEAENDLKDTIASAPFPSGNFDPKIGEFNKQMQKLEIKEREINLEMAKWWVEVGEYLKSRNDENDNSGQ